MVSGACRCHDGIAPFCVFMNDFAFFACCSEAVVGCDAIFHIIELRVLFFVNHFFVGESRLGLGVPVDHTDATIDESFCGIGQQRP